MKPHVMLLPGWLNSGPGHWQTLWEARHGWQRVEQADWNLPLRGDWMARLEEEVMAAPAAAPLLLAAHSLGCHLVAAWAAHSRQAGRVAGALLVAPPDVGRADLPPQLHAWRHPVLQRLPFASTLVYSSDDPYAEPDASQALATAWGSQPRPLGPRGHLNADSGLGEWPEGQAWLMAMGP